MTNDLHDKLRADAMKAPDLPRPVPVVILQKAFADSGLTAAEVAYRMGWLTRGTGDSSRVKRRLGIHPYIDGRGKEHRTQTVKHDRAIELLRAMGHDPVDYGL